MALFNVSLLNYSEQPQSVTVAVLAVNTILCFLFCSDKFRHGCAASDCSYRGRSVDNRGTDGLECCCACSRDPQSTPFGQIFCHRLGRCESALSQKPRIEADRVMCFLVGRFLQLTNSGLPVFPRV